MSNRGAKKHGPAVRGRPAEATHGSLDENIDAVPQPPSGEEVVEAAPPLPGKTHPRADMGFVVPANDDERREAHRNESASTIFDTDPDVADAAADLGADLGTQFLEGAAQGEDTGARVIGESEARGAGAYLVDEEAEAMYEESLEDDRDLVGDESLTAPALRPPRRRRARGGASRT